MTVGLGLVATIRWPESGCLGPVTLVRWNGSIDLDEVSWVQL